MKNIYYLNSIYKHFWHLTLSITACLCLIVVPGFSQTPSKATISGEVVDVTGKPMEFVTMLLLSPADSTLVKGAVTDVSGKYEFENMEVGTYLVAAIIVGYQKTFAAPITVKVNEKLSRVPTITLKEDIQQLKAVEVKATKPFIEQQVDKTVVNVENSLVATGVSALEVLEKAPGVMVDAQNERISMKGREGVLIMIDGKPTYLSAAEVINLLKSTPSNSINSIELITNPSAKYDAAGNSGIINIKLKRSSRKDGMNGNVVLGGGYGRFPKANAGLTLNLRQGTWSLFGNYNYDYRKVYGAIDIRRRFTNEEVTTFLEQKGFQPNENTGHTFKVGADYFIGKKNTIGVLLNGILNDENANIQNENHLYSDQYALLSSSAMTNKTDRSMNRWATNLNFKHTFDSTGQELTVDADYSAVEIDPKNFMSTHFYNAVGEQTAPVLYQQTISPSQVLIRAAKADYVHPLSKKAKIEGGWKSAYVTSDNDVRFEECSEKGWQVDPNRTNQFVYKETIQAAYINASVEWKKWALQAGLRGEQTHSNGNSVTLNKVVIRNYVNLFPSAFLTYSISEKHQMRYSYSRRIDRPNYLNLNPFIFVMDPYAYYQGNPYLNPQFTDALQVAYTWKGATTLSVGYNRTTGVMTSVTEQDDQTKVVKQTVINLNELTNIDLTLSFPLQITRWWNTHQNATLFRNKYNADYLGQRLNNGRVSGNLSTNHTFILTKGLTAEVNAWYNTPQVYGLNDMRGFGQVSVGIQQSLWDNKASIRLNVSDVFHTTPVKGTISYQNMDIRFRSRYESQTVRLNFTYNFGNTNIKSSRSRRTSVEDEQNRVN